MVKRSVRVVLFIALLGAAPQMLAHPGGVIREGEEFRSQGLKRTVRYSLYLPAAYQLDEGRRFPVLYLLHGFPTYPHHSDTDWVQAGNIAQIMDEQIGDGSIPPMIVVMPGVGKSWYVDAVEPWGSMVANELVAHVDDSYRTRSVSRYRAIAGLSMGGFGALLLAMNHPDLYSTSVGLSAGIFTDDELIALPDADFENGFAHWLGDGLEGEERITKAWRDHSLLYLAQHLPTEDLQKTRWYLDIGDDDDLLSKGNGDLHIVLRNRGIAHEYRVRDGDHTWEYWRSAMPEVLQFVSESFW